MRSMLSFGIVLSALGVVLAASPVAYAQVDCSNPDNLCTGDPCVIPTLTVQSPCQVDFGARTVIIGGTLRAVLGDVSLTAQRIEVQGGIKTSIELHATDDIVLDGPIAAIISGGPLSLTAGGNVEVNKPLTLSGYFNIGAIRIIAGGDVDLRGRLLAADRSGKSRGGDVEVDAGGVLTVAARIFAEWQQTLSGAAGVVIGAGIRGVFVAVSSTSGSIAVEGGIRSSGGPVDVDAAGDIVVKAPIRRNMNLNSLTGNIIVDAPLQARHGNVFLTAPGQIMINRRIRSGYSVRIVGGTVAVNSGVAAIHRFNRGQIRFYTTVGDLTLSGRFRSRGGTIEAIAAGNLIASGRFGCNPDGCIALSAGGILDTTGATFDKAPVADCPGSPSGAFLDRSTAVLD